MRCPHASSMAKPDSHHSLMIPHIPDSAPPNYAALWITQVSSGIERRPAGQAKKLAAAARAGLPARGRLSPKSPLLSVRLANTPIIGRCGESSPLTE